MAVTVVFTLNNFNLKQHFRTFSIVLFTDVEINAQGKRLYALPTYNAVDASSGCNPSSGIPSAIETIVLVKKGTSKLTTKSKSVNKILILKKYSNNDT